MKKSSLPFAETFRHFLPLKEDFIRNRRALVLGFFSLLMVDLLLVLIPLVIKRVIDLLTVNAATPGALLRYSMIILGIALLIAFFRGVWRQLIFGHSRKVEESLRNRMYAHLQTLSPSFYQRTKTGDLMARAINDINAVRMAAGIGLVALADGLVLGIAAIGFMMSINLRLTVISLIPAPAIIVFSSILTRRMSTGFQRVQATFSSLTERVREAFAGIRVTKAYGRESWQYRRIRHEGKEYITENMRLAKNLALFFPMMAIFANTGLAIVIWVGGRLTILGDITTGDFVAFISYLNLLTWPMMAMGWVTNLMQRGSASMRRINAILDEEPEIKETALSGPMDRPFGGIEIRGLTIRYQGQTDYALKDVSFKVKAGETIAVVGRVGSGKTTLLKAIPRLFNVPADTVYVDGRDINQIPLRVLRENTGFATQDVFVFSDSVRNNVLFGRGDVPGEQLEAVLRVADFMDDVEMLEKGMDTLIGERGITLSGGQRQRLTIARALFSDPPILILDDALSMVDTSTEERILNHILKQRRDKTTLIASHRLTTISRADRIIVLERGELAEEGSHRRLLELGGVYATIYEKQALARELETGVIQT